MITDAQIQLTGDLAQKLFLILMWLPTVCETTSPDGLKTLFQIAMKIFRTLFVKKDRILLSDRLQYAEELSKFITIKYASHLILTENDLVEVRYVFGPKSIETKSRNYFCVSIH